MHKSPSLFLRLVNKPHTEGKMITSSSRKKVIGELTRGREVAGQLRHVLTDDPLPPARVLVGKILDSFNRSISILADCNDPPPPEIGRKSEDSDDSKPRVDRRGRYKRRRNSETWIKETPSLLDDGHAWRKYGQKMILNAKHPRNYFRCTHKFDEVGCQASKQVQKIQDDPPLYRTTYHGHHVCNEIAHEIMVDASAEDQSSVMWSFCDASLVDRGFFSFDTGSGLAAFSSGGGRSSAEVVSCTASNPSMEMDMIEFDDFLELQSL